MKKTLPILLSLFALALCARAPSRAETAARQSQNPEAAQATSNAAGHFAKDGLSFDYPAGWTLGDKSGGDVQQLVLFLQGSSARVQVVAHRQLLQSGEQVSAARKAITIPYVKDLARKFGLDEAPDWKDAQCLTVGKRLATGLHFSGRLDGEPSAADVFTVVLGQRLVHLVYTRADKDDAQGSEAWKVLLGSIAIDPPPNQPPGAEGLDSFVSGGVLTGSATKKPIPEYPSAAKAADAGGTVTVQIVVDERGDVVSARAVAGHPTLFSASESAARRAKFKPTLLCGRPVRVSGFITYNFVR